MFDSVIRHLRRLDDWAESSLGLVGAIALLGLFWLLVSNIVGRYFGFPIVGTIELSRELMLFAIFFGLALAQRRDANVRVGILVESLPARWRSWLKVVQMGLGMLFAVLLTAEGSLEAMASLMEREFRYGPVEVPMYPGRIALALGSLLLAIRYYRDFAHALRQARIG